ncbi:MAG: DinB family protein [Alphaproteobacteria bacterium]
MPHGLLPEKLKQRKNNNPMKHPCLFLTAALFFVAASAYTQTAKSSSATAAATSPSTPPTIASAIDREISIVEKEIVDAAEAMPENKFDFSPEKLNITGSEYKGVRTFGQQLKHVAASNYLIWSPITGEKPPDTVNEGKGPDNMKSKAEIIKYLKESFAFGHKAVATLNGSNLVEPITSGSGKPTTRLFLATFAPAHCFDHYGQLVEYLRMNGIVPPASRGK